MEGRCLTSGLLTSVRIADHTPDFAGPRLMHDHPASTNPPLPYPNHTSTHSHNVNTRPSHPNSPMTRSDQDPYCVYVVPVFRPPQPCPGLFFGWRDIHRNLCSTGLSGRTGQKQTKGTSLFDAIIMAHIIRLVIEGVGHPSRMRRSTERSSNHEKLSNAQDPYSVYTLTLNKISWQSLHPSIGFLVDQGG